MYGIKTIKQGDFAIRAACETKTIIVSRDDALNYFEQHRQAAMKLATQLKWSGKWAGAIIPGIKGMVWLRTNEPSNDDTFEVTNGL